MSKVANSLIEIFTVPARLRAFFGGIPSRIRSARSRGRFELLEQGVNLAGILVAAVFFLGLFLAHLKVVAQPGPQEYNEPAIWETTWLLDHGRNPYSLAELPGSAYCFGPLYNYVVIALEPLLGIDYPAHRMVSLVFLILSLVVMARAMRRAGAGLGLALLSVVFYYWMSLGNIEITARPDTLGLFFFLLGILIPWFRGYTIGSSVAGLLCALVAFSGKPYFVVAGCATLLIHFLVRDRREACWLGVGFFALVGLSFALCCYLYPYFYIESIIVQRNGSVVNDRDDISVMHTVMLFERGWPFFLMMICGVGAWLTRRRHARRADGGSLAAAGEDTALLAMATVFVIFLAVVYFYMGRNAGAYFTYHLHLLFPLMLLLSAYSLRTRRLRVILGGVLIAFFLWWVRVPEVTDSTAAYRRMEELVRGSNEEILGIACTTDMFERTGRPVLHNGNTMFIGFAFANDAAVHDPKIGALAAKFEALDTTTAAKITARKFGMVFSEFDDPYFCSADLLRKNYDKIEQIEYYTYFGHSPVRVWVPKPRAAAVPAAAASGEGSKEQGAGKN
ncbi:MAG: hypothetical protein JWM35_1415 [Verrucomicrobia bacterium]|nr:hypothetical protein [Verrucomicrobiota bacterium]